MPKISWRRVCGGHVGKDLDIVVVHLTAFRPNDYLVVFDELAPDREPVQGSLAVGPLRGLVPSLNPDPAGLHQPVVAVPEEGDREDSLDVAGRIEDLEVRVAPDKALRTGQWGRRRRTGRWDKDRHLCRRAERHRRKPPPK